MKNLYFLLLLLFFPLCPEANNDVFWELATDEELPHFQPNSRDNSFYELTHECGLALVRLRKPLEHYVQRYGDAAWGVVKLLLLMEKQRNRGQDGSGIAIVQLDKSSNQNVLHHFRSTIQDPFSHLANYITRDLQNLKTVSTSELKQHSPFIGEIYLGHMRYATYTGTEVSHCQPFIRAHAMPGSHFALAGNFNMANTSELRQQLKGWGVPHKGETDTEIIAETIAYYLEREHDDLPDVIKQAATKWDGGYVFCGAFEDGNVFICRDPAGIRPGFYFANEEVIAVASERIALMETFGIKEEEVLPIKPGHLLLIPKEGEMQEHPFTSSLPEKECIFERIYFSNANDPQIYKERKALGHMLAPRVFEALGKDISHAVFTYVPNSGLLAFQGLVEEIAKLAHQHALQQLKERLKKGMVPPEDILKLPLTQPRTEFIIEKKKKLRTFISSDQTRQDLVRQVYHVTQGVVTEEDILVVVEDSIVRGTTLRESLMNKFINLNPKKIIVVSSAPPICYPDCYGIDMSQIGRFVAYQAAVSLLEEQGNSSLLQEVYELCLKQKNLKGSQMQNEVERIYDLFTLEEISDKIAQLVTPADTDWKGSIQLIYQSLEDVHRAINGSKGDWYFSGNYPTPGGVAVLNNSYLKWFNHNDSRSY